MAAGSTGSPPAGTDWASLNCWARPRCLIKPLFLALQSWGAPQLRAGSAASPTAQRRLALLRPQCKHSGWAQARQCAQVQRQACQSSAAFLASSCPQLGAVRSASAPPRGDTERRAVCSSHLVLPGLEGRGFPQVETQAKHSQIPPWFMLLTKCIHT